MTYELKVFAADFRGVFKTDGGPNGREQVRVKFDPQTGRITQMTSQRAT